VSDQILLPAVEAAMERIARVLAHDEAMRRSFSADQLSRMAGRIAGGLHLVITEGRADDHPVARETVEWVMAGGDGAETVARVAAIVGEVALNGNAPGELDHGEYIAYAVLALALECGVMAHRPEAGGS
jgi:hypothetical protein